MSNRGRRQGIGNIPIRPRSLLRSRIPMLVFSFLHGPAVILPVIWSHRLFLCLAHSYTLGVMPTKSLPQLLAKPRLHSCPYDIFLLLRRRHSTRTPRKRTWRYTILPLGVVGISAYVSALGPSRLVGLDPAAPPVINACSVRCKCNPCECQVSCHTRSFPNSLIDQQVRAPPANAPKDCKRISYTQ